MCCWCPAGPLLQLRHLTALELSGTSEPAAEVLAQMTQLVTLSLPGPNHISDTGLLQLTALARLTLLQCWQSNPAVALMAHHARRRLDSLTNKVGGASCLGRAAAARCVLAGVLHAMCSCSKLTLTQRSERRLMQKRGSILLEHGSAVH
jgi:hypothetical protein